jgi:hypothetical protein
LKEDENFRVREKRTEIREITSLHHKSNKRKKYLESKQNTRVIDVKWRPNRFLEKSRLNSSNRMHKNDESFRRSRRIHGRDYSFSGENDAPHGPASGNRKENSLPTIKKLRQINEGLEGVSERLKQNQTLNIGGKVDPMLSRK